MKRAMMVNLTLWASTAAITGCGEIQHMDLPERPTMGDVQRLVFAPGCISGGCHSAADAAGELDLSTSTISYQALVDIEASNATARARGAVRVRPGDPDSSFLFRKLVSPGPGEGAPMPTSNEQLTDPYLDLVARWIEQGALP